MNNAGGQPLKNVEVGVVNAPEFIQVVNQTPQTYPVVEKLADGALSFRASKSGTYRIAIGAKSSANRPVGQIDVTVYPKSESSITKYWWEAVLVLAAATIGVWLLLKVTRRLWVR